MPELPEMEVYRRLLSQTVLNKPVVEVEIRRERTVNVPMDEFIRRVNGRTIRVIRRRGKHLLFHLDSDDVLLLHLMLGGWMYYGDRLDTPSHQSQVVLTFADGQQLFFQGLRLGYLHIYPGYEVQSKMSEFGPEPLDPQFTVSEFQRILQTKRGPVKFALANQHTLAGIGNCYSDEACFEAGILPIKTALALSEAEAAKLYEALQVVLPRAISLGGYMEFPYYRGDLFTGGYNHHCLVYDRGNEPCIRCKTPITHTMHNRRKVFYCAHCQH